ncbi:uncharacterized protein LOC129741690 [Uranotaenia lowii]|uniref:uncharacterized protein LOC129741690 n=1 Tax=Uranotaenia lowii TaxID=190385 RepID=UPI0024799F48|nr:uncharacterized protein LOC129741690 [Uranotaenia lowii]
MSVKESTTSVLAETRKLSQSMRAAYDVSQSSTSIGETALSMETLRSNLFSLIEQAKIRIHKASINQTAPMTEKQAKLLNDSIYSASSILRKQEQLATMENRLHSQNESSIGVNPERLMGENFHDQMANLMKKLNCISIEMSKLKRASDNIMNIYNNYQLENENCDSEEDEDSGEGDDTIYKP